MSSIDSTIVKMRKQLQKEKGKTVALLAFLVSSESKRMYSDGQDFHAVATALEPLITENVSNPETWGLLISNILWNTQGSAADYDEFCLQYGPKGTEAKIDRERDEAEQWAKDLAEAGISPSEALSLSMAEAQMIAFNEDRLNSISSANASPAAIPQELIRLVLEFYRPSKRWQASRGDLLAILNVSSDAILKSRRATPEELVLIVAGRVGARMKQIRGGTAQGRWVISQQDEEIKAVFDFAYFLVWHVLQQRFQGDASVFSSRQWTLILDAVWAFMLLELDKK